MIGVLARPPGIRITVVPQADFTAAFDQLVYEQSSRLFAIALGILRNRQEAEDAVQETMFKAWKSWHSVRAEEKRNAWLARVCVNHCISRYRQGLRAWLSIDDGPEPSVEMDHVDPDMDQAYRRLSSQQRVVITLHYQQGYSLDECAEIMKIRPGTVRSHLARALEQMRVELADV
jgi:RNA polymerase sigma-70 factor (ECF subfamily)